ncbi:hypothetical protein HZA57_06560, partial [Candidatus Poribacteria bacterium]|nr:hypothetical protein [Candidatus Poribacteria bacterium]
MRLHWTATRLILLAVVVSLFAAGCKAPRARVAIKKTQQFVAEMENLNAATHAPQKLEEIRGLIDRVNQLLQAGQAGDALVSAKQAQELAEQALAEIRADEARSMWDQAEEEIRVADVNGANRLDPQKYQKILELRTSASQARDAAEFMKQIADCRSIRQEVDTLLSELRTEADRRRLEAQRKLEELKSIGGQEEAPETVITVQDIIASAQREYDETRDYVLAQNQFKSATLEAERGIEEVLRVKSRGALDEIENLLATSLGEGAREFVPDEYERIVTLHESLITDFAEGRFNKVLLGAKDLKPRAQTLVLNTKRKAADSRIRTIKNDIDALVEGGAREYLPGRVEVIEGILENSKAVRQEDNEAAFDRIKEMAVEASDEADKVNRAFEDLASEQIRLAANRLDTTDEVYGQVAKIFEPITNLPAEMKPFEDAKEARRVQLGRELTQAREALVVADARMREQKYRNAILLSQDQAQAADNILGEIYKMVANNAVVELSNLISRYERDGARIYSPDELERSNSDLTRVRDAINEGNSLLATELAAAARSNVELMAQRISGRAVEDISEARDAFESATSEKTKKYSPEILTEVRALISKAEEDLQAERLKMAVENANRATEQSRAAQEQANRLAAGEAIKSARAKIERGETAGADLYAGRDMEDAKKLIGSSDSLYAAGDFEKAEQLALSCAERADQAFYKKVNDAEAAIADAKAVGGWEYDNHSLGRASSLVRVAREDLEGSNYSASAARADEARSIASSVASAAKQHNFDSAVARIRENLESGRQQGINYFQVGDSIQARQRLAQ